MNNMGFSKTLWWSMAKPGKYDEMIKIGLKKAIKYFFSIIAILAIILAIIGGYIQLEKTQEIVKYIDKNVPEFEIKDTAKDGEEAKYVLKLENNDTIILDYQEFVNRFKSIVVINPNMKEKEAIQEYYKLANDNNVCTIFLKDKCIIISSKYSTENENKEDGIIKYTYLELRDKVIGTEITEFSKDDLISTFNKTSYIYYIIICFISYFKVLLVVFVFYIIILAIITKIISKLFKQNINIKRIHSLSIYSMTLSMILYIVYLIINYFVKLNIDYFNVINMVISIIYIILYFYMNNKKMLHINK